MATNTYVALKTVTISGTSTNDVTITGIPQGYTDLVIVTNLSNIGSVAVLRGQFNGDTTTSYSSTALNGDGSSSSSGRQSNVDAFYMTYQGHINSTKATGIYHIMNYSNSTTYKTVVSRSSNASFGVDAVASLWRKTDPITSIRIVNDRAEYWTAGSTINVYGISDNGATGSKAIGGDVYYDSTYAYHVFTSSGKFIPTQALTADYLVVAGGGGGGSYSAGGGGGAGGLRSTVTATGGGGSLESAVSLSSGTPYYVTIGAGGAGAFNTSTGTSGGATSIYGSGLTTISTVGGGYGGGYNGGHFAAATGGSGGGANYATYTTGAAGTTNQGYAGGNGVGGAKSSGGGGGGAGAVGGNGSTSNGGNGGNGVLISALATATSTGVSGYYAGGGGGATYDAATAGTGGLGGGGNANGPASVANPGDGYSGVANTGGGGGAAETTTAPPSNARGGAGGSGIVIIRYPK